MGSRKAFEVPAGQGFEVWSNDSLNTAWLQNAVNLPEEALRPRFDLRVRQHGNDRRHRRNYPEKEFLFEDRASGSGRDDISLSVLTLARSKTNSATAFRTGFLPIFSHQDQSIIDVGVARPDSAAKIQNIEGIFSRLGERAGFCRVDCLRGRHRNPA